MGREGFLLPFWLEGAATQAFAPRGKNPRAATVHLRSILFYFKESVISPHLKKPIDKN